MINNATLNVNFKLTTGIFSVATEYDPAAGDDTRTTDGELDTVE